MSSAGRALAAAALLAPWPAAAAQSVMIAPAAVVIDDRSRSTSLTLISQDTGHVEVTISTVYGYAATDSGGRLFVRTFTTVDDTMPAASRWVRSYPERVMLEPGERRTVRLVATPPATLPPGEYWGRVVVAARGGRIAVGGAVPGSGVSAALDLEIRSVLGLFYRKGTLKTGVGITALETVPAADSLVVRPHLVRTGSAAFVGTLRAELRDERGEVRAATDLPLGVYYSLAPRLTVPITGLPAGRYRLAVRLEATRPELAKSMLVPARPVHRDTTVTLP